MVDFASTQVQSKEVSPPASHHRGQYEATAAKPLSTSPLLTADWVDKMYRQLAEEIQVIVIAQLAECARWHRFDSPPNSARAGVGQTRPVTMPSTIRFEPSPLTDFSSMPHCGSGKDSAANLRIAAKLARVARTRCSNTTRRARGRADIMTSLGARLKSHTTLPPSAPLATMWPCFAQHREAGRQR
jgi:hypothetical protein